MTSDNLIAFSDNGIWVAEPDGGNRRRLAGRGESPVWSLDGARILHVVDHGEKSGSWSVHEAWVVSADGSDRYRLTGDFIGAFWSPNGRCVAYIVRKKNQEEAEIGQLYIAEADGSQRRYVSETWYHKVRWSPDGRRLAYMKPVPGGEGSMFRNEIWMVRADGSEPRRLSPDGSDHRWSPNGDRIAYDSYFFGNADGRIRVELWVEEANGQGRRKLVQCVSEPPRLNEPPWMKLLIPGRWSPDGESFVYTFLEGEDLSDPDNSEVWVARTGGGGLRKLGDGETPEWSPDGKTVLFWRYDETDGGEEEPVGELWQADAAGNDPRPCPSQPAAFPGAPPDPWILMRPAPDGKRAVYALPQEKFGEDQRMEIWTAEMEGGSKRLLTEHGSRYTFPLCEWSPDGRYFTYVNVLRDRRGRVTEEQAWVAQADGSHRVMLSARSPLTNWRPLPPA